MKNRLYPFLNSHFPVKHGLILLYHCISPNEKLPFEKNIHNVCPYIFEKQILWLKENFKIVSLNDWLLLDSVSGYAAITFDDAYMSVFEYAAPILLRHKLPFTVFINGKTMKGEALWRDKIRFLIDHDHAQRFCIFLRAQTGIDIDAANLYRQSKSPEKNSAIIDQNIDQFITQYGIALSSVFTSLIARSEDLIRDPLITYGNHTYSHYIPSSLNADQQRYEIMKNKIYLEQLQLPLTPVFSLPFGGERHLNESTRQILKEADYSHIAFSRHRLNQGHSGGAIERWMPPNNMNAFHRTLLTLRGKSLL